MGIHTGLVVFGSVGGNLRMEPTAIGDAANIAARLQGAAEPGTIIISEETRQLARGYVRTESVGPLTLKGKSEPMAAYRLLGVSHRFVPDETTTASRPFVNRTSEMAVLNDLVRPVAEGRGQALGIVGEPGIGKSRLLAEFRHRLGEAMIWIEGRCLSYGTSVPYLLVLDLLRGLCRIGDTDMPGIVEEKLRSALGQVGMDPERDAPLLLHLLGIEAGGNALAVSSPEAVKAKAFQLLCQLFVNSSRPRPLVLMLEDLHWIDEVSDEFLAFLAESVGGARILLLATYRPGYRSPWIDRSYAGQLALRPLSRADSPVVASSIATSSGRFLRRHSLSARLAARRAPIPGFIEPCDPTLREYAANVSTGCTKSKSTDTGHSCMCVPAASPSILAAATTGPSSSAKLHAPRRFCRIAIGSSTAKQRCSAIPVCRTSRLCGESCQESTAIG